MKQTLRILLEGLIDYAGLFPPASLAMGPATENYARYVRGEHRWMLGRFICPASRLGEFTQSASVLLPGTFATSGYREHADDLPPWRLSVTLDTELDAALDSIDVFNAHHADEQHGLAIVDAIELRAPNAAVIDESIERIPESVLPFYEIPWNSDVRGPIAALAGESACAKIRCGGVEPSAIPSVDALARFIDACAAADVRFKATAGLHHPIRAEQALTYDEDPPRAMLHGFLNVFVCAVLRRKVRDFEATRRVLEATADAFDFGDTVLRYDDVEVEGAAIAHAREAFAVGFGSCSFEEPIADLAALGLV